MKVWYAAVAIAVTVVAQAALLSAAATDDDRISITPPDDPLGLQCEGPVALGNVTYASNPDELKLADGVPAMPEPAESPAGATQRLLDSGVLAVENAAEISVERDESAGPVVSVTNEIGEIVAVVEFTPLNGEQAPTTLGWCAK